MLRILKPGGHLLWTMKTVQDETTTSFKSFDANLNGLHRAGRINVSILNVMICLFNFVSNVTGFEEEDLC